MNKIEKELVEYKEYCPLRKKMRKVRYYKPKDKDYVAIITNKYKVIKTDQEGRIIS